MTNDITETRQYGPKMLALTAMQRRFVELWCEHPNFTAKALAQAAGYQGDGNTWAVAGHRNMHDDKVLAAMDEEASTRMRYGGVIGVNAVVSIALNPSHKDHLKAALALMDRTGRHATTEQKITVDDKRPQTKAELIAAIKNVATELGLDDAAVKKLTAGADETTEMVIDAEFTEIEEEIDVNDL